MDFLIALDKHNVHYTTPPETWNQIAQYLPKGYGVEVWEAFYNSDITSAGTLRELRWAVEWYMIMWISSHTSWGLIS